MTTILRLVAKRITEIQAGEKTTPENLKQTTNERGLPVWKITTASYQYEKVGDDPGKLWTGEGFKTRVTKKAASLAQLATEFGDYWDQTQEPLPDAVAEIGKKIDELVKQAKALGFDAKRFTKGEVKTVVFEKIIKDAQIEVDPSTAEGKTFDPTVNPDEASQSG